MRKSNFVSLAIVIRDHNARCLATFGRNAGRMLFSAEEIEILADWCQSQAKPYRGTDGRMHSGFHRDRFMAIANGQGHLQCACGASISIADLERVKRFGIKADPLGHVHTYQEVSK